MLRRSDHFFHHPCITGSQSPADQTSEFDEFAFCDGVPCLLNTGFNIITMYLNKEVIVGGGNAITAVVAAVVVVVVGIGTDISVNGMSTI